MSYTLKIHQFDEILDDHLYFAQMDTRYVVRYGKNFIVLTSHRDIWLPVGQRNYFLIFA